MGLWSRLFGSRQEPARRAEEPRLAPSPIPVAPPVSPDPVPLAPEAVPGQGFAPLALQAEPQAVPEPVALPAAEEAPLEPEAAPAPAEEVQAAPKWVAPSYLIPRLPPVGSTPITRRLLSAMQSLGFDASGWTEEQARIVLAAKDYFEVFFAERGRPPGRYKEVRLACIRDLVASARLHEPLLTWAAEDARREQDAPRDLGSEPLQQAATTVWQRAMDRK